MRILWMARENVRKLEADAGARAGREDERVSWTIRRQLETEKPNSPRREGHNMRINSHSPLPSTLQPPLGPPLLSILAEHGLLAIHRGEGNHQGDIFGDG